MQNTRSHPIKTRMQHYFDSGMRPPFDDSWHAAQKPLQRGPLIAFPDTVDTVIGHYAEKFFLGFLPQFKLTHISSLVQSRNDRNSVEKIKQSLPSKRVSLSKPTESPMSKLEMRLISKLMQSPTPHSKPKLESTSKPMPYLALESNKDRNCGSCRS